MLRGGRSPTGEGELHYHGTHVGQEAVVTFAAGRNQLARLLNPPAAWKRRERIALRAKAL
jgi:hypothetical protein